MKKFAFVLAFIFFTCLSAKADHITLGFGPSINGDVNPKMGSIGYEKIWGNISIKPRCGAIFSSPWNGWCSVVVSTRVETVSGFFMRTGLGPAYFQRTSDRLSSRGQINMVTAIGMVQAGYAVGLEHNHFSNAGIVPPNPGSDSVCLVAEIKI